MMINGLGSRLIWVQSYNCSNKDFTVAVETNSVLFYSVLVSCQLT
jgi:hypothetical protein